MPVSKIAAPAGPLPSVVDHRLDKTESAARNQGKAPSCTAVAMAAAIDHAVELQEDLHLLAACDPVRQVIPLQPAHVTERDAVVEHRDGDEILKLVVLHQGTS